ncbi:MAG TPA: response regulator [Bryobacteraceae bacterium]|nr:response regulator [Bryobacteraceae bacterium]
MDRKTLNVLLIEDSPDYAGLVQQWLSGAGDDVAFVLNWNDSLTGGLDRLAQGAVDVVLLDLGLPDSEGVDTFLATRARAAGIPIVILSAAESESLALQMIQEGADDYLVKSTCTADLLVRTLRYAVTRRQATQGGAGAPSETARMIGVIGVKGGVGTTTVACNLAAALRTQTGQEVLLSDLDVSSGLVAFLMGLEAKFTIVDAIKNVDRLDRACWDVIVAHAARGLQVIASPGMLGPNKLPAETLRKILGILRRYYQWIVIDFGRVNGVWQSLSDRVDEVFVVTTTSLPALHEAKRVIDVLVGGGMDRERLRLIVNQTEDVLALSGHELKRIFGIQVYATLPNDSLELHRACLQKKLPPEDSNFSRQVVDLARKVAGLGEKRAKRNLPDFLSFVERFRKSSEDAPVARVD